MSSKFLLKIITVLIFAVVIAAPLFYFKQGIYPFLFDKVLFFQALVEVLFGLWLVFAIYNPEHRPRLEWLSPRKNVLMFALAVFVAALILTAFTGVDAWRSFFSTYERAYGVFGIMHMAAFAVILASLRKELPWRWIFAASIATSAVIAVLAWLEFYYSSNLLLEQARTRAGATFGNPSFLAGYLMWNSFLSLSFLLSRRAPGGLLGGVVALGWKEFLFKLIFSPILLGLVVLLEIFTLVFVTQSRGNILGLVAGIFVLLVLFAVRPPTAAKPSHEFTNTSESTNNNSYIR